MKNHSITSNSDAFAGLVTPLARLKSAPKTATNILLTAVAFIALGVLSTIGWTYGVWQKKQRKSAPLVTKETSCE